jgi:hypothetical protein
MSVVQSFGHLVPIFKIQKAYNFPGLPLQEGYFLLCYIKLSSRMRRLTEMGGKNRLISGDNAYAKGGKVPYILQLVIGCWVGLK